MADLIRLEEFDEGLKRLISHTDTIVLAIRLNQRSPNNPTFSQDQ